MYITRHIEQKLSELLKQFPVVALTGPRQTGKSQFEKAAIISLVDEPFQISREVNVLNLKSYLSFLSEI
jgi:predicted AAA+ superfamily ATPase